MIIELHILQNFVPSNLNRDDTGAPKGCKFGGHDRARISSQCLKRAIRRDSHFADLLEAHGGVRTRRLVIEVAKKLRADDGRDEALESQIAAVFAAGGIERPARGEQGERDNTRIILFVDHSTIDELADCIRPRLAELANLASQKKDVLAKDPIVGQLADILARTQRSPDIALFGRMIEVGDATPFGKQGLGRDAACQVAHAISTNRVSMELDFFTAVEELPAPNETGAAMMDVAYFNSACFYRYASVDYAELKGNLASNDGLARATLSAFLRSAIHAVPSGKQNSMAAHNPPSLVFAVVRERGQWNLANAFLKPVHPTAQHDLVAGSATALDDYWGRLTKMYGEDGIRGRWLCTTETIPFPKLAPLAGDAPSPHHKDSVAQLVDAVVGAVPLGAPDRTDS
jgi:CRISPR system Cascade subunit CasC